MTQGVQTHLTIQVGRLQRLPAVGEGDGLHDRRHHASASFTSDPSVSDSDTLHGHFFQNSPLRGAHMYALLLLLKFVLQSSVLLTRTTAGPKFRASLNSKSNRFELEINSRQPKLAAQVSVVGSPNTTHTGPADAVAAFRATRVRTPQYTPQQVNVQVV